MKLLVLRMNLRILVYITVLFLLIAGHFAAAIIVTSVEGRVVKSINDLPHLQSVLLACRIEQNTTALETSWKFDGVLIDDMSSQFAGRTFTELSRLNASTLVTVLHINRLSYRDAGVYTCEVKESRHTRRLSASVTVTLLLEAQLIINTPVRASDKDPEVELHCEMQGYIRPDRDLRWLNINLNDSRFTVEYQNGQPNGAQFGGDNLTYSRVSVLKISNPTGMDSGWYVCALFGTDVPSQSVNLIVTKSPTAVTEYEMSTRPTSVAGNGTSTTTEDKTTGPPSTNHADATTTTPTTEVPIILIVSVLSGIVGVVIVLLMMCVIALWRKRQTQKTDADDTNTELSTETQSSGTSLATPAFPLQSQGSTRSTTSYYVNEGLGPMYYSSVNGGDHGNEPSLEYDYIPADVSSILMTTNPAYQSTSYPSSASGAIQDKNSVSANYDPQLQRRPHPK